MQYVLLFSGVVMLLLKERFKKWEEFLVLADEIAP